MKNKAALALSTLSAVCLLASPAWANHHDCKANSNKIVLDVDLYYLELKNNNKKTVCLLDNGTFKIEIKQKEIPDKKVLPSDVNVIVESGNNIKLDRLGTDDTLDYITVKAELIDPSLPLGDAKYKIVVKDIGELDPRVRVVGARTLQDLQYEAIDRYLRETFDLGIQEVQTLTPPNQSSD